MLFSPFRRRFGGRLTVWIAMLAILFSALAPAVSHAIEASHGSANWVEICTVAGTKMVQLGNGDQPKPTSDALSHHLKNCPYCAAHAGGPALPPVAPVTFAILGGHDVFPALFYTAPSVQFAWSAAAPRGPPALV